MIKPRWLSTHLAVLFLASSLSSRAHAGLMTSRSWEVAGTQANEDLGQGIVTCDLNHDGHKDLILGVFAYDGSATDTGKVFVYLGTASGPSTAVAWTAEG